jgi:hypothetical protein
MQAPVFQVLDLWLSELSELESPISFAAGCLDESEVRILARADQQSPRRQLAFH